MGVDSKVFVVAGKDKALEVGEAALDAVTTLVREQSTARAKELGYKNLIQFIRSDNNVNDYNTCLWTLDAKLTANSFEYFQICFTLGGENRSLGYFTDCSCDTDDITKEHTLLFSISHYGQYAVIMQRVVEALIPFGKVYWDHNDCDDEDYVLQN